MSLSEDRKRTLLLAGILGVVLATGLVQYLWQQKKEAAAVAQANRPEARAQAALQDADRATLGRDLSGADRALLRARKALDEVLLERPTDEGVQRSRLVVARRLANVAEQAGKRGQAQAHFSDAWRRAQALFEAQRTSERARLDLLTVARESAAFLTRAGDHSAAAQRTEEAAKAVEASLKGLTPPHAVRVALVETWEAAARAHGAAKMADAAVQAARQAVTHAEAAVKTSDQPQAAMARLSNVTGEAAKLASELKHADVADLEDQVIRVLRARLDTAQDPDAVRRSLSIWLAHRAERMKATDDAAALAALEEAIGLRKALVERRPEDADAREEYVRALNAFGAFHSEKDRDDKAVARYAEAARVAAKLPDGGGRMRLIALGNQAHVLGRLDRIVESRAVAEQAWTLGQTLADAAKGKGDADKAAEDAARAGLRYARVLRAPPKPRKTDARAVVMAAQARLAALKSKRAKRIGEALAELAKELGG